MTHRRLFYYLFIVSSVMLAAAWGYSLRYSAYVDARLPGYRMTASVHRGTLALAFSPFGWGGYSFRAHRFSVSPEDTDSSPWGTFQLALFRRDSPTSPMAHALAFPMWFPYLLLLGGAGGMLAWRKRRGA